MRVLRIARRHTPVFEAKFVAPPALALAGRGDESTMSAPMMKMLAWLDTHINVKSVYRRLQAVASFLILGTFIDDGLRVLFDYSGQVSTMGTVGIEPPLSSILPAVFILTQGMGVFLVLSGVQSEVGGDPAGVGGVHPFIHKRHTNGSCSVGHDHGRAHGAHVERAPKSQGAPPRATRPHRVPRERASLLPRGTGAQGRRRRGLGLPTSSSGEQEEEARRDLLQLCGRICIGRLPFSRKMAHERLQPAAAAAPPRAPAPAAARRAPPARPPPRPPLALPRPPPRRARPRRRPCAGRPRRRRQACRASSEELIPAVARACSSSSCSC